MTYLYAKENVALGYGNQIGKIKTEITRKDDDPAWTAGADDDGNLIKVTVGEVRQKKRAYLKNLANDIRAAGLDPEKRYSCDFDGRVYSGSNLMNAGLNLTRSTAKTYSSVKIYLKEEE